MQKGPPHIANNSDYIDVAICFADPEITELFSALVEAHGGKTIVIEDISLISPESLLITEPQLYARINHKNPGKCLVVGNKEALKDCPAIHLSRPLTEEKIETALKALLLN